MTNTGEGISNREECGVAGAESLKRDIDIVVTELEQAACDYYFARRTESVSPKLMALLSGKLGTTGPNMSEIHKKETATLMAELLDLGMSKEYVQSAMDRGMDKAKALFVNS